MAQSTIAPAATPAKEIDPIEAAMIRLDILIDDLATFQQRIFIGDPAQQQADIQMAALLDARIAGERLALAQIMAAME